VAVLDQAEIFASQLWIQGDIRDPLGIWGFRHAVTGTGDGGGIKVEVQTPVEQDAAYIYTVYSATVAQIAGVTDSVSCKVRLLTNWPNVDVQAGVQAYGKTVRRPLSGSTNFTQPTSMPDSLDLISPLDRFILLFDPRPSAGRLTIMELEIADNVLADSWSFEGYGYYWDRSVQQAPGGLRHPGAN